MSRAEVAEGDKGPILQHRAPSPRQEKPPNKSILKASAPIAARLVLRKTFNSRKSWKRSLGEGEVCVAERFKSRLGKNHEQRCVFSGSCLRGERGAHKPPLFRNLSSLLAASPVKT